MDDILQDIVDVLESWTNCIIDVEYKIKKFKDIQKIVQDSLNKQVVDGLISEQDSIELEYTCDLWIKLCKIFLYKSAGVDFSYREVLSNLLELYSLKQISKKFFISTALELCPTPI